MVVGQQGVVDGSNHLLLTTILPLNLGKAEEEEGCKEQRQIGDGRHLKVCGALGCSAQLQLQLQLRLREDMTSQKPTGASIIMIASINLDRIEKVFKRLNDLDCSSPVQ